jgi:hypothetical protein
MTKKRLKEVREHAAALALLNDYAFQHAADTIFECIDEIEQLQEDLPEKVYQLRYGDDHIYELMVPKVLPIGIFLAKDVEGNVWHIALKDHGTFWFDTRKEAEEALQLKGVKP